MRSDFDSRGAITHPLLDFLKVSVHFEIINLRDLDPDERIRIGRAQSDALRTGADTALCGGGRRGETAGYVAALTKAVAVMAYQPGGITLGGQHWCVNHAECLEAAAYAAANPGLLPVSESEHGPDIDTITISGGVL